MTSDPHAELAALDVPGPAALSVLATYDLPGHDLGTGLAYGAGSVLVVTHRGGGGPNAFALALEGGALQLEAARALPGGNLDVALRAGRAYVATRGFGGRLAALDVSDPRLPREVPGLDGGGKTRRIRQVGPYAYLAGGAAAGQLSVVDPGRPVLDFYSTMVPQDSADEVHVTDEGQVERARKAYERLLDAD